MRCCGARRNVANCRMATVFGSQPKATCSPRSHARWTTSGNAAGFFASPSPSNPTTGRLRWISRGRPARGSSLPRCSTCESERPTDLPSSREGGIRTRGSRTGRDTRLRYFPKQHFDIPGSLFDPGDDSFPNRVPYQTERVFRVLRGPSLRIFRMAFWRRSEIKVLMSGVTQT
jgi:hypothetical protein